MRSFYVIYILSFRFSYMYYTVHEFSELNIALKDSKHNMNIYIFILRPLLLVVCGSPRVKFGDGRVHCLQH